MPSCHPVVSAFKKSELLVGFSTASAMGAIWSGEESNEDYTDSDGQEWSISVLYSVMLGKGVIENDDAYYSDGAWCDKCGDNAGMEADVYCVDCEAYFCCGCCGRWHHPGGCNELHSLEQIVKDEAKGVRILTPLLDELLIGFAAYMLISGLNDYVDKDYLRRSDICPAIRRFQDWLAWTDTLLFYHFKDFLMTSCSNEDNFWKLLLDGWVRTVVTDSDSLLLLLRTLPNALLIHYLARTFIVPPFAVVYAVLLVVVRTLEAQLPRTPPLLLLANCTQQATVFVSSSRSVFCFDFSRCHTNTADRCEFWRICSCYVRNMCYIQFLNHHL